MYYLLQYKLAGNYLEARAAHRPAHFDHLQPYFDSGALIMGGAFDGQLHAALIFKVDDPSLIEEFAKNDPYVVSGVVTDWEIRKWNVAIGG